MLKQSLLYLFLSVVVVLFKKYAKLILLYIDILFAHLVVKLSPILAHIGLVDPLQKVLLLVLIPLAITTIPAGIFYLIKRKTMPHYLEMTWCIWLVIVLSYLLIR